MGAMEHKTQFKVMDYTQWDYVSGNFGRRRILRNRFNGKQIEEYSLTLSSENEITDYYEVFNWRLGSDCLVNATNYKLIKRGYCGNIHNLIIHVQRVKDRLYTYKRLTEEDALYCLQISLEGFHEIYKKFGCIDIEESMFCINKQNQMRVWLSQDISNHKPWSPYMGKKRGESDMVKSIIDLIDAKLGSEHGLKEFIASICQLPHFQQAKFITLLFMKQKQIKPQYCFKSLCKTYFKTCQSIESETSQKPFGLAKNSLSQLLLLRAQDSVNQSLKYSTHKLASSSQNNTPQQNCNLSVGKSAYLKQTSTATQSQNISTKKVTLIDSAYASEEPERQKPTEALLSGLSSPAQLSAIMETQHQSKQSRRSSILIPQIPISTKSSGNQHTRKATIAQSKNDMTLNITNKSNLTLSSSSKEQRNFADTNSYEASSNKVSIKNMQKPQTPVDIKAELNSIRRTFSICVASQKMLAPDLRYHASELIEPHSLISYEVITSDECQGLQRGNQ